MKKMIEECIGLLNVNEEEKKKNEKITYESHQETIHKKEEKGGFIIKKTMNEKEAFGGGVRDPLLRKK